jgi:hypothetical protein
MDRRDAAAHVEDELAVLDVALALRNAHHNDLMPPAARCPRCGEKVYATADSMGRPCTVVRDDERGALNVTRLDDGSVVVGERIDLPVKAEPDEVEPRYRWHTNGVQRGSTTVLRNVCGVSVLPHGGRA